MSDTKTSADEVDDLVLSLRAKHVEVWGWSETLPGTGGPGGVVYIPKTTNKKTVEADAKLSGCVVVVEYLK